jgi:hypothetical protein
VDAPGCPHRYIPVVGGTLRCVYKHDSCNDATIASYHCSHRTVWMANRRPPKVSFSTSSKSKSESEDTYIPSCRVASRPFV